MASSVERTVAWAVPSFLVAASALALGLWTFAGHPIDGVISFEGPLGPMAFHADGLSGAFLLLVGLVGLAAALAAPRHTSHPSEALLLALFLAGLAAVPLAADLFTFLVAWEIMSVAPGLLLVLQLDPERRRAGVLYLTYAHISAACLVIGLLVWNGPGNGTFAALTTRPPLLAALLLLIGAAVKAGLMPFHLWLPEAHPAAPSHVSALMSGVMVSLPAYLLFRLLIPVGVPAPLALTLLLVGAASAALASLHALHPRDLKRILALTTVAHMGTLFALLGLAMLLGPASRAATYATSAAVVYAIAHGLSKGTLFLVAGEIHHATGELDLERLGGLRRQLPGLATLGFLGALSLAALPPLAGFPAELGLLAAFFQGLVRVGPESSVPLLASLFLLAVAAGAGLVAVAKITLGAFFGPSRLAHTPHPVPRWAHVPAGLLVLAALLLGLLPGLLWNRLPAGASRPDAVPTPWGSFAILPLALVAILVLLASALAARTLPRPQPAPPWACGLPPPTARQAYTPHSLVTPYRILFNEILRPASDLSLQEAPVAPFAPSKGHVEDPAPRFIEPWVHEPLGRSLFGFIERLRRLHRGSVHTYLIIALVTLLVLLFTAGGTV